MSRPSGGIGQKTAGERSAKQCRGGGGGGLRGRGRGREESSLSPLSPPVPLPFTSLPNLFSRFAPRPFFALSPRDSLFTGYKHSIYFRRKLSLTLSVKGKFGQPINLIFSSVFFGYPLSFPLP